MRAKRASIPTLGKVKNIQKHHQGVLLEPRTMNEELLLDPDLGGTDDLKSDLRDL